MPLFTRRTGGPGRGYFIEPLEGKVFNRGNAVADGGVFMLDLGSTDPDTTTTEEGVTGSVFRNAIRPVTASLESGLFLFFPIGGVADSELDSVMVGVGLVLVPASTAAGVPLVPVNNSATLAAAASTGRKIVAITIGAESGGLALCIFNGEDGFGHDA